MSEGERRRGVRRSTVQDHGIVSARVRPGHHAAVLDVSAGGALIETEHRLLPGTAVELQMETSSRRASMKGRVLRCSVSGLQASSIRYRGAIGFDRQLSWFPEEGSGRYGVAGSGTRAALGFRAEHTPRIV
jgi:hypothetical protein